MYPLGTLEQYEMYPLGPTIALAYLSVWKDCEEHCLLEGSEVKRLGAFTWLVHLTWVPDNKKNSNNEIRVDGLLFIGRVNMHGSSFMRIRAWGRVFQRWMRLM